jgi:hypothetical protein
MRPDRARFIRLPCRARVGLAMAAGLFIARLLTVELSRSVRGLLVLVLWDDRVTLGCGAKFAGQLHRCWHLHARREMELLDLCAIALFSVASGKSNITEIALIEAGAVLGFLRFNTHPARASRSGS